MRGFHDKGGYILIGLVLFFSILALSGTVGVFEQDTRLKRFQEGEFKTNLDTIRRALDLYRYRYSITAPDPIKLKALEDKLKTGPASEVIQLLAQESFLRARSSSGHLKWRRSQNLVRNSSFELDLGSTDPDTYKVGGWRGNFTPGDLVPDGWELTTTGAFQKIDLSSVSTPATFVVSFWAKCASPTATVQLRLGPDGGPAALLMTAGKSNWSRYYQVYSVPAPAGIVHLEFELNSPSGATAYVDGVMLEEWAPPTAAPATMKPVPSAWVASFSIVSDLASETLQQRIFADLLSSDTTPASMSWWMEW